MNVWLQHAFPLSVLDNSPYMLDTLSRSAVSPSVHYNSPCPYPCIAVVLRAQASQRAPLLERKTAFIDCFHKTCFILVRRGALPKQQALAAWRAQGDL